MTASRERKLEGAIVDVSDLPWALLMSPDSDALGHAIRDRRATQPARHDVAADPPVEAVSAFNNYI